MKFNIASSVKKQPTDEHPTNELVTKPYPAKHFIEAEDQGAIVEVIKQNPLATLLYFEKGTAPHISHIPFHFNTIPNTIPNTMPKITPNTMSNTMSSIAPNTMSNKNAFTHSTENKEDVLIGYELMAHVSNHHPLALQLKAQGSANITLVFNGEDGYVSPLDVSEAHSEMQKVPTWNYAKVHINGHVEEITGNDEKYQQMLKSSDYFEQIKVQQQLASADDQKPWSLDSAPRNAINAMLNAITFFKLTITHTEGRFKLSQNKPKAVQTEITNQVTKRNKSGLAQQI